MLVSSTSMKAAMATTTPITQGLTDGCQGSALKEGEPLLEISDREVPGCRVSSAIIRYRSCSLTGLQGEALPCP
jgi:hypothetical protein